MAEAYCVKDKQKVEVVNPQKITMKNGKPALSGHLSELRRQGLQDRRLTPAQRSIATEGALAGNGRGPFVIPAITPHRRRQQRQCTRRDRRRRRAPPPADASHPLARHPERDVRDRRAGRIAAIDRPGSLRDARHARDDQRRREDRGRARRTVSANRMACPVARDRGRPRRSPCPPRAWASVAARRGARPSRVGAARRGPP